MGSIAAFALLFGGFPWLFMLGLGGLHDEVSTDIPAVSFPGAVILCGMLYLVSFVFAVFVAVAVGAKVHDGANQDGGKE